jgi:hypothetical protein
MERQSQIFEVELDQQGETHRATYFVERDMIFTSIGGRMLIAPLGSKPAMETVKSLLSGFLLQQTRKLSQAGRWTTR